jgi:hypothetical protein
MTPGNLNLALETLNELAVESLIPNVQFRAAIDRLAAETPNPPDLWIDQAIDMHLGEVSEGDRELIHRTVRDYIAARLTRQEVWA